jgi:hypothetical protein
MSFTCDINSQYLEKVYNDLQKDHQKLMTGLTNGSIEQGHEKGLYQQISTINNISLSIIKLKKQKEKMQETSLH